MIRGRHRGLPVAIDRSILLPSDLEALHGPPVDAQDASSPELRSLEGTGFSSLEKGLSRKTTMDRRRRSRTTTSNSNSARRYSGGQPTRRMPSSLSASSRLSDQGKKENSTGNGNIQFAPTPTAPVRRETPSRPALNTYLSTIYSEAPSPSLTPNNEKEDKKAMDDGASPDVISTAGPASTSSGEVSGKDSITVAGRSESQ